MGVAPALYSYNQSSGTLVDYKGFPIIVMGKSAFLAWSTPQFPVSVSIKDENSSKVHKHTFETIAQAEEFIDDHITKREFDKKLNKLIEE